MESYKKRRPNIKLIAAALGVLALVCVGVVVLVLGGGSGDTPVKMPITQAAEYVAPREVAESIGCRHRAEFAIPVRKDGN